MREHLHSRILSFKYAFEGTYAAWKEEPNLKFHFLAAVLVLLLGWFLQVSRYDWVILFLVIGFVLSLELTNTAIEAIVDSFTPEQHPRAKYAKDIAAAAVLIGAIIATIIGLFIFVPYL